MYHLAAPRQAGRSDHDNDGDLIATFSGILQNPGWDEKVPFPFTGRSCRKCRHLTFYLVVHITRYNVPDDRTS